MGIGHNIHCLQFISATLPWLPLTSQYTHKHEKKWWKRKRNEDCPRVIIFRGISSILILHLQHLSSIYLPLGYGSIFFAISLQGALCNDTDEDDLIPPPSSHKNNSFQMQTPSGPNLCLCVTLYLAFGPFKRIQEDLLKSLCRVAVGSIILDTLKRIPKAHSAIHCTRETRLLLFGVARDASLLLSVLSFNRDSWTDSSVVILIIILNDWRWLRWWWCVNETTARGK